MRIFTRRRWFYLSSLAVAGLCALAVQCTKAQPPNASLLAMDPSQVPRSAGISGGVPMNFTLIAPNGDIEGFTARRVYTYQMEPGAAKPKRLPDHLHLGGYGSSMAGMGSGGGMSVSMGIPGGEGMYPGGSLETQDKGWPILYALVLDETDNESADKADGQPTRATIKVAVQTSDGHAEMGMGMAGAEGMMASMSASTVFMEIDKERKSVAGRTPAILKTISPAERTNLAQLIRLDVWIEDARTNLRERRNNQEAFAVVEAQLKSLLTEEYDTLLAKQRGDAERLRKRLDQLQADLERRARAKDRVVDVQLGRLVLEAQGLIDTQR